jgi:uncharacterized protein (TIGR02231 family)
VVPSTVPGFLGEVAMYVRGIFVAFLLIAVTPAHAADIPAPSKIATVTVFPSGAEITRVVKLKLAAGAHTLLVNDFTSKAILSSIRIEALQTDKLKISSVDVSRVNLTSTDPAIMQSARKRLEDELETLSDQRAAVDNVIKAAETQKSYLENLSKLPHTPGLSSAQGANVDWQALTGIISNGMNDALRAITEAKLKHRGLDRAISDLRKRIAAAGSSIETRPQVRIFVSTATPLEAELRLRYQVEDASWRAFYDARLTTGDEGKGVAPSLVIARHASIEQKTGEDWGNVILALSTTRPGHATAARQPETLRVDFAKEADDKQETPASKVTRNADFAWADAPQTTPAEQSPVSKVTDAFQTIYDVPGRTAVKANGEAKRIQLGTEKLVPSLLVLTIPRFDLTAYLYARLKLPKNVSPLLAGPVALFRDGVFAGNGQLPQLAPGEEYELGFGTDERVRVQYAVIDDKKGETGTFTTSRMEERHYAIAIKNLHARPIKFNILDRIPVAMHQDIKVDFVMDMGPQPMAKDVNGRRGVMLWVVTAKADEEKRIAFGYRITSPANKPIIFREPDIGADANPETFLFGSRIRF